MSDRKLIAYPYRGVRTSYYVYHPAKDGPSDKDGQWERAAREFRQLVDNFCDVSELYSDQQTHHEVVGGEKWKKEVMRLLNAVEKDGRDVYQLEALAEAIFDRDIKIEQRVLPYHEELKKRSGGLRAEDLNLSIDGSAMDPNGIIRRGWAS